MEDLSGRLPQRVLTLSALGQGLGVFIVGTAGSGRTHFLAALRDGLAEIDEGIRRRIWIGDDLHRLDPGEASRLARAVISGQIVPLVTIDRRSALHPALDSLWRDGIVLRIDLAPLPVDRVHAVVEGFLGGPLDSDVVQSFVPRRDGGDLVILLGAVAQARVDGTLVNAAGVWTLTGPVLAHDDLRRQVFSRLGESGSPGVMSTLILDLLGLVPEISAEWLAKLVRASFDDDDLGLDGDGGPGRSATPLQLVERESERLEDAGVIAVTADDDEVRLRIQDAAVELVLPQTIGVLRRRRLTSIVVAVFGSVDPSSLGNAELLALARSAISLGHAIAPEVLNWAARTALQSSRPELALRLGLVSIGHGGGLDAQLVVAAAESQVGRADRAISRLDALRSDHDADPGSRAALDEVLEEVTKGLSTPSFRWTASSASGPSSPRQLAADLQLPPSRERTADAVVPAVLEGERESQAATLAVLHGRIAEAYDLLDHAESVLAEAGVDIRLVQLRRAVARSFDGHLDNSLLVIRRLRDESAASGQTLHRAMTSTLLGELLFLSGRSVESVVELRSALPIDERIGMDGAARWVKSHLASSLALMGRGAEAAAVIAPVAALAHGTSDDLGAIHEALGYVEMARGHADSAVKEFQTAADHYESSGNITFGVVSLSEAARAGGALSVRTRIHELLTSMDAGVCALLGRYVSALADCEEFGSSGAPAGPQAAVLGESFDSLADEFSAAGLNVHAAEAFSNASELHSHGGRSREAAASARRAESAFAVCGVASSPFLATRAAVGLSPREIEIAELALAGQSNREIAGTLVLSVRTVETHLQRVYQKLGIRTRTELVDALPGASGQTPVHPGPQ